VGQLTHETASDEPHPDFVSHACASPRDVFLLVPGNAKTIHPSFKENGARAGRPACAVHKRFGAGWISLSRVVRAVARYEIVRAKEPWD